MDSLRDLVEEQIISLRGLWNNKRQVRKARGPRDTQRCVQPPACLRTRLSRRWHILF